MELSNAKKLIQVVASHSSLTQKQVKMVVEDYLNCLASFLEGGEEVRIEGFGRFYVADLGGYQAKTGIGTVDVPDRKRVKFKPYFKVGV